MQRGNDYAWHTLLIGLAVFTGLAATISPSSLSPVCMKHLDVVNIESIVVLCVYTADVVLTAIHLEANGCWHCSHMSGCCQRPGILIDPERDHGVRILVCHQ